MLEKIKKLAADFAPECVSFRRHLHAHPELSFVEWETSAFIQGKLKDWGIPFQVMAKTGVVGIIEGKDPGSRVTALRADMDALPIREQNDVPYRSKHDGIMHACGHDAHTACLLGAAKILNQLKGEWTGTIKLIFQPGEEKNPGGASLMIGEGVLENPVPQRIFALHVHPGLETGKFSFRGGKVMASADEIYMTIKGKGGHAAAPHLTVDTILIASHLVVSLQQMVSRHTDPFQPAVLSITSVQGGNTTNVIPSEVKLMGTLRAMDETLRFRLHDLIRQHTLALVESMGASVDVEIDVGYPFVMNDEALCDSSSRHAAAYAGEENVLQTELRMGAEDFAFYSHQIPACFFRLGTGNKEKNISSNVHTPTFDIDERAIEGGMGMMAWLAIS